MEIPPWKAHSFTGFQQEGNLGTVSTSGDGAYLPALEFWLCSIALRTGRLREGPDSVPAGGPLTSQVLGSLQCALNCPAWGYWRSETYK